MKESSSLIYILPFITVNYDIVGEYLHVDEMIYLCMDFLCQSPL